MRSFLFYILGTIASLLLLVKFPYVFVFPIILLLNFLSILLPYTLVSGLILTILYLIKKSKKFFFILKFLYFFIYLGFFNLYLDGISLWEYWSPITLISKLLFLFSTGILLYTTIVKERFFPQLPFYFIIIYALFSYINVLE